MHPIPTSIPDVVEIRPIRHTDSRGYFSECFRADWFEKNIGSARFVQDNLSFSEPEGVIRGFHFQAPPFAQGKLVQCVSGAIFDVAFDIRSGSPTFAKWVGVKLDSVEGNQLWIPPGFLHGFCTLSRNVLVSYKVTAYYSREHDFGVRWNDPAVGIDWPKLPCAFQLSSKD